MTNARYRRKQLARRDGSLAPLPPDAPGSGPQEPSPTPGPSPAPAPDRDPDSR